MESHSCEKTRGEGVLPEIDTEDDSLRCRHIDALDRRCRMFVATPAITSGDPIDPLQDPAAGLCPHHAQRLLGRQRATEATAAELLASVGDFSDAASVNRFLGNLVKLVALKRIPRKNAVTMAYISQLILNSQAAQDRRELMRLRIADLDAQQQKNLPTRVIWDLPLRHKPQEQDAGPTESGAPEIPQPSGAPAAAASAQSDDHASNQLAEHAPALPPNEPARSSRPPVHSVATPSREAPEPSATHAAAPDAARAIPGVQSIPQSFTTDWYALASSPKPKSAFGGAFARRRRLARNFRDLR